MARQEKKIPALTKVFWTAELKKVAIARLQGGISWAELILVNESIGLQPGVLLFDSLEAARAYIRRKNEAFAVVVELPVKSIEKELLVRCQEFDPRDFTGEFRQWIYPNHIWFDTVKFHKIETVAEDITDKINKNEISMRDAVQAACIDTSTGKIHVETTKKATRPKQSTVVTK